MLYSFGQFIERKWLDYYIPGSKATSVMRLCWWIKVTGWLSGITWCSSFAPLDITALSYHPCMDLWYWYLSSYNSFHRTLPTLIVTSAETWSLDSKAKTPCSCIRVHMHVCKQVCVCSECTFGSKSGSVYAFMHFCKILCYICHFCASKCTRGRVHSMPITMMVQLLK